MKPAEALHDLENYGGQAAVPALSRNMPREQLGAPAKEWARSGAAAHTSAMLDALTQQPRGKSGAAVPASPVPPFKEPEILFDRRRVAKRHEAAADFEHASRQRSSGGF